MSDAKTSPAVGLLMTRPLASARRFVADLPAETPAQLEVIYNPLMEIEVIHGEIDASDTAGLIFTSGNGVAAAKGRVPVDLPAYCVGARTTAEAGAAGWSAQSVGRTAEELIEALKDLRPECPLLHLHGRHTRGDVADRLAAAGLPCRGQEVYDQILLPLSDEAKRAFRAQTRLIVPIFSPRTARHFAEICPDASNLHLIAFSHAVEQPLKALNCKDLQVCTSPEADAMAALVRDAAARLVRVEGAARGQ
ncbi:uroporphyrinogen-III synthase [Phaeobacter sp. PT47_59]|uniref:uroporphyrinogen-III synthase n=1 Tax=Phaeobacter sp. PT47_59 TaxID=3029979 RepID=UPI0023804AE1|nr:uroporphyrinogen-III synthase [Phaeobacter sp. PT47_59]MDE4175746.1 uroporphyrinogen-III synthase [Phaeobacter sp. PT47_59]